VGDELGQELAEPESRLPAFALAIFDHHFPMPEGDGHGERGPEGLRTADSERGVTIADDRLVSSVGRGPSGVFSAIHETIGRRARIGRDHENDIVVDDLLVSRFHAELRAQQDGTYELVDLGSRNGTFVNGRAVERAALQDLDIVTVGHHMFRLLGTGLEEYVDTGSISFEARELSVRASDGRTLLAGVTFSLDERAFLAVAGPSGAGKSTLLGALTGRRPATEGEVLYDGQDLYRRYDELRYRIGYVPQQDVLYGGLTVAQTLDYAAQLRFSPDVGRSQRTTEIGKVLAQLGIEGLGGQTINRLSGGQRRRVAVAMELVTKPSLLFLDEPTSGLDPGNERGLMTMLRELADAAHTVITVTHAMASVRLCDRLLLLAPGGRPAYFGPPQLAPAAFGCNDLQEVFELLNAQPERGWSDALAAGRDALGLAGTPAVGSAERDPTQTEPAPAEPSHQSGVSTVARSVLAGARRWSSQLSVLVRRQTRVILADRRYAMLLVAQPLILGVLMLAALPANQLAAPLAGQVRAVSEAGLVLLVVVLGATWVGAGNAIGDIVRERPIIQRERATGLGVSAYIASKVIVLGTLTAGQCAVMALLALARQGSHDQGSVLAWPLPELLLAAVLAGLGGMAIALLISAVASTAAQAMTILPVVLVLELLLAMGGLFPSLIDKPVLKQLSYAASTQWSFAASASSVDLDRMQAFDTVARVAPTLQLDAPLTSFTSLASSLGEPDAWQHRPAAWLEDVGLLVALGGLTVLAAGLAVHRRAPGAP
jgi:ABC-type multidrug transport system ATPase subunit